MVNFSVHNAFISLAINMNSFMSIYDNIGFILAAFTSRWTRHSLHVHQSIRLILEFHQTSLNTEHKITKT